MKRSLVLLVLCASVAVPVAAFGQPAGPPPNQAMMEKMRADAKAAAYSALTPAHATAVTALIAQVAAGTLDPRAAGGQIDALLTPDEQKAVLAAGATSRQAMRASGMMGAGGPPPPGPGRYGRFTAGRYLLMVSLSRGQMRSLMPRARSTSAP